MPQASGQEVIEAARKDFEEKGLPMPCILVHTALGDPRIRETCLQNRSVDYFLEKPVSLEYLKHIID